MKLLLKLLLAFAPALLSSYSNGFSLVTEQFYDGGIAEGIQFRLESADKPGYWLDSSLTLSTSVDNAEYFIVHTWNVAEGYDAATSGPIQLYGETSQKWWRAENGGGSTVTAGSAAASGWETFDYEAIDSTTIAIKRNENYVCYNSGLTLEATTSVYSSTCAWKVLKIRTSLDEKIHGVNLGGWLVLEKWMTPTLFSGLSAADEYHFCQELGYDAAKNLLDNHYSTYIDLDVDFAWLQANGVNAIRIPVGHWHSKTKAQLDAAALPFVETGLTYLDEAFNKAATYGLKVLISMHGLIGSQNGWDHSGVVPDDSVQHWTDDWSTNLADTVASVEFFASRYANHSAFLGIGLVNEPYGVDLSLLHAYYLLGYAAVRKYSSNGLVFMSDAFYPKALLGNDMIPKFQSGYYGIAVDSHNYQVYTDEDKALTLQEHVDKAEDEWGEKFTKLSDYYMMVSGEFSIALDSSTYTGTDDATASTWKTSYASAQTTAFDNGQGWFFWSYSLEPDWPEWSLKKSVVNGWLAA